ncbi:MAG: beta-lactamase domain protein [Frankiales bacterium]|jgi:glyoxylase-like metal-dependent hydrolase (beta-lactamase superfamily II)|nr:beta-lactamase domain protein [Frankiales bacterium]
MTATANVDDVARAPSELTIDVFTTPGRPIVSALPPQAPDDEPTWSPMSATLIYGDGDAILVDALATYDQADALADWVQAKGRRLSRVYITHGHGDHWLGLTRLTQRFPGLIGLATAEVLAHAQFETTDPRMGRYWNALFPGEVPEPADRILPELLTGDSLDLDGNEVKVLRIGQADTAQSTVVHVPALAAVVTGDLAYNEVHMMTAETGDAERDQWIANLDTVASLNPAIVVAGHKKVDNGTDPKIIAESQQYLRDFTRAAAEESTAAGIATRMIERYPDWQNHRTIWYSASAAIKRKVS